MIEILFLQCFSFVDSMMVGHMPDSATAVAGLSLCGAPINLTVCVTAAFFIGTTASIARNYGAEKSDEVRNTAFQTTAISFLLGIIITAVTYTLSGQIMGFVCKGSDAYEVDPMFAERNNASLLLRLLINF